MLDSLSSQQILRWHIQVEDWRSDLGCKGALHDLRPWTRCKSRKYIGLNPTSRIMAILDLVAIQVLGGAQRCFALMKEAGFEDVLKAELSQVIVDVSQNPCRRAFSNAKNISKCWTSTSILYSYKRDGIILPFEQFMVMGHPRGIQFPSNMSQKDIQKLAGQSISLPCLGLILAAMWTTTGL